MSVELDLLYGGASAYMAAAVLAMAGQTMGRDWSRPVVGIVVLALGLHGGSILLRWQRLDHGPYVNMFEVLSSNAWTLHAGVLALALLLPRLRPMLAAALPVLQVIVVWMLFVEPLDTVSPVTYDTVWLPVHVWLGKVFLALVVGAVGLSLVIVARALRPDAFSQLPRSFLLNEVSFRLVLLAFVFQCLMLTAGAVWAQDAWGRFWQWDPLETWSFLTWIAVAAYLHLRVTWRPAPVWSALIVLAVFVLAFGTFFGMPFVSTAPHKGMV